MAFGEGSTLRQVIGVTEPSSMVMVPMPPSWT